MLIRPARAEDARAIAGFIAMAESEMVHHFTGTTDPAASETALMEYVLSPTENRYSLAHNLVADIDGAAVGSLITFPADRQPELDGPLLESMNRRGYNLEKLFFEGTPGTLYLSTLGVNPDFRGRGVGSALIAEAMKKAREAGFEKVSFLVSREKPRAMALYERLGFVPAEEVRIGDVDYVRMGGTP